MRISLARRLLFAAVIWASIPYRASSQTSGQLRNGSQQASPVATINDDWASRLRAHLGPKTLASLDYIAREPKLYASLLSKAKYAYDAYGWPAAKTVVNDIEISQLKGSADDDSILACQVGWEDIFKTLRLEPEQCRAAVLYGENAIKAPEAAPAIKRMAAACGALRLNGAIQRQEGRQQTILTTDQFNKIQEHDRLAPEPLSSSEQAALDNPTSAPAATLCEARLKHDRNDMALPSHVVAAFIRSSYRFQGYDDVVAKLRHASEAPSSVPNGFVCPPAGTTFQLSMKDNLGIPVFWTSLYQDRFDCIIKSSVSGKRGLWAPSEIYDPARPKNNVIRSLWPITLYKHVHFSYHPCVGDDQETEDVVSGFGLHSFAGKQVPAYEIAERVSLNGGQSRYTVFRYWSPEMNWIIGQRTIVYQGFKPDDIAPDWHVVSVFHPPDHH